MWWKRNASSASSRRARAVGLAGRTACERPREPGARRVVRAIGLGHELLDAAAGNTWPITEAGSIDRSLLARERSRRAASRSAWIVGGTTKSEIVGRARAALERRSSPSSIEHRPSARRRAGCPRPPRRSARRIDLVGQRPSTPSRSTISARLGRGQRLELDRARVRLPSAPLGRVARAAPAGPGRPARRSEHASRPARCSSSSRNVGSAQWTSSKTTTSGRSAASASSSLRTPQNSSPTGELAGTGRSPPRPARRSRASRSGRSSSEQRRGLRATSGVLVVVDAGRLADDLGERPERDPVAVREAAAAEDASRRSSSDARNSSIRRDLPTPALADHRDEPAARRVDDATRVEARARAGAPARSSRPDDRRVEPPRARRPRGRRRPRAAVRRRPGSALPLSSSGSTSSYSTAARVRRWVISPTITVPGSAAPARAARRR